MEDARPLRFMTEHRGKSPALADAGVFREIEAMERRLDAPVEYNYQDKAEFEQTGDAGEGEGHGVSVFLRDGGTISTSASAARSFQRQVRWVYISQCGTRGPRPRPGSGSHEPRRAARGKEHAMVETTPHLPKELPPETSDYSGHRLDGARDLYLLALALGAIARTGLRCSGG